MNKRSYACASTLQDSFANSRNSVPIYLLISLKQSATVDKNIIELRDLPLRLWWLAVKRRSPFNPPCLVFPLIRLPKIPSKWIWQTILITILTIIGLSLWNSHHFKLQMNLQGSYLREGICLVYWKSCFESEYMLNMLNFSSAIMINQSNMQTGSL